MTVVDGSISAKERTKAFVKNSFNEIANEKFESMKEGLIEGKNTPHEVAKEVFLEIRTEARKHGKTALDVVVDLMQDSIVPPRVRLSAAVEILDRGYGKASMEIVQTVINKGEPLYLPMKKGIEGDAATERPANQVP